MRTYILPSKDASIYQIYPSVNTGLGEILEVGKTIKLADQNMMYSSGSVRSLISFDISNQSGYPESAKYYLRLYLASAENVNRYQELKVYPISRNWIEGSGYRYQDVQNVSDGVTWQSASKSQNWDTSGSDYVLTPNASASLSEFPLQDVRIDVTNIVKPVILGTNLTPWNGMVLMYPTSDETDAANRGNIKFFSSNTHTIFSPKLEIVYSDQIFNTGSLKQIPNGNVTIFPKNLKEAYTQGEVDKVYLVVRDPYPDKRFDEKQRYRNMYYLPSESYYRITDQVSGVTLQDFDQYSAISCDNSGSYFILDTNGLEVNRYYTVDLKVKKQNLVFFPEFTYTFKIDNND